MTRPMPGERQSLRHRHEILERGGLEEQGLRGARHASLRSSCAQVSHVGDCSEHGFGHWVSGCIEAMILTHRRASISSLNW
jgi:hypothetical protein